MFARWRRLGLNYIFLGMEALDAEGLDLFRKRISPDENMLALERARSLGLTVAINLIVDLSYGYLDPRIRKQELTRGGNQR